MSVSPEPETIDICTPPDSPNNVEITSLPSSPSQYVLPPTESPHKRIRPLVPRRVKRRRVGALVPDVAPATPSNQDGTRENNEDFGVQEERPIEEEFAQVDPEIEVDVDIDLDSNEAIIDLDTFEDYMDLVLADCADFYQILPTLFVVQGWDGTRLTVST